MNPILLLTDQFTIYRSSSIREITDLRSILILKLLCECGKRKKTFPFLGKRDFFMEAKRRKRRKEKRVDGEETGAELWDLPKLCHSSSSSTSLQRTQPPPPPLVCWALRELLIKNSSEQEEEEENFKLCKVVPTNQPTQSGEGGGEGAILSPQSSKHYDNKL